MLQMPCTLGDEEVPGHCLLRQALPYYAVLTARGRLDEVKGKRASAIAALSLFTFVFSFCL